MKYMKIFASGQLSKARVVVFVLFFLVFAYGLLYFGVQKLNGIVFQEPVVFDESKEVEAVLNKALKKNSNNLSVVYIWKRYCPCNLGVNTHYSTLFNDFLGRGVDFYIADLSGQNQSDVGVMPEGDVLKKSVSEVLLNIVKYSPAVAILNEKNELLYYGPHSLDFVCNADTSIVRKVVSSLQDGIFSKNTNVIGKGCFCSTISE